METANKLYVAAAICQIIWFLDWVVDRYGAVVWHWAGWGAIPMIISRFGMVTRIISRALFIASWVLLYLVHRELVATPGRTAHEIMRQTLPMMTQAMENMKCLADKPATTVTWSQYPMKQIVDESFANMTIVLDGKEFIDCYFGDNLTFEYDGTLPTKIVHAHFGMRGAKPRAKLRMTLHTKKDPALKDLTLVLANLGAFHEAPQIITLPDDYR